VTLSIIGCIASWGTINFCTVEPLESSGAALIQKEFPQLKKPLFLPPYSPFLNPIEDCWAKVKKNTRKH
jgi:transposase